MLVIDTVCIKTDAFTSVDRLGTPQSTAMHVIEHYRLIDAALATAQIDKYETNEDTVGGGGRVAGYHPDTSLKGLQLEVTMKDPKVFYYAFDRPCHLPAPDLPMAGISLRRQPGRTL